MLMPTAIANSCCSVPRISLPMVTRMPTYRSVNSGLAIPLVATLGELFISNALTGHVVPLIQSVEAVENP